MIKVRQTNDRKVVKVCKQESQSMSSELKLLEKVQNKKAQKTPSNLRDLGVRSAT